MATEYADRDFLEFIIKSIVDHPEDVKVERKIDEMGVLLTLKVNPQDMGQVIGRKGSTSSAIRSLLRIVGIKNNARVNLKIEEPEGGQRGERRSFREENEEPKMGAMDKVIDDIKDL
ncbi:MAG: KH domain-containing protein [Candidatus Colwellbacteria bacterium]|nr:KH domain-containing protein [Candidatus Colwellbacteria bacterium]